MAFAEHIARVIKAENSYTCTSENCEEPARSFYPVGTLMYATGLVVANGDWNVQASHLKKRDYRGKLDYNRFNTDGSERGTVHCTMCHAVHEVGMGCYDNAENLLMSQTIRTFDWIKRNDYIDADVPLGVGQKLKLGRLELIEFNNRRRGMMQRLLLERFGRISAT